MKKCYFVLALVLCLLGGYAQAENLIPQMSNLTVSERDQKALFDAVDSGNLKEVKELIGNAKIKLALVNVQDKEGDTPLMFASSRGNLLIMKELVQNGAFAGVTDNQNWTALCMAATNKNWEALKYLVGLNQNQNVSHACGHDGREGSAFSMAVFYGAGTDVLSAFIDKKANVNEFYKGNSLLMMAVAQENMAMVKLLVEKGRADVNASSKNPENYGQTAAFVAVMKQNVGILKYLLDKGATLNSAVIGLDKNLKGINRTPMQVATTPQMQEFLRSRGYTK